MSNAAVLAAAPNGPGAVRAGAGAGSREGVTIGEIPTCPDGGIIADTVAGWEAFAHIPGTACASWTSISHPPGICRWGWLRASSTAASMPCASMIE